MDKQHQARCRVLKRAHITFKGHGAAIECTVRNLSDRGACLKVESPIEFRIHLILYLTTHPLTHPSAIAA
jgi:hypothetical protein